MSLTVAQFRARFDEQILAQLTDQNGAAVDVVKLRLALADAMGVIDGYLFKLDESDRPPASTVEAHQASLALSALAGNRPGAEYDSIRSRAKTAIDYLSGLSSPKATVSIETEVASEPPLFTAADLKLFAEHQP